MTAIKLLEKLGADASFNAGMLSEEDKKTVENLILNDKVFNAIVLITVPEEEESEEDTEDETET